MTDASRIAFYENLKKHEKDERQVCRALDRIGAHYRHITDQKEQHYGDIYLERSKLWLEIKIDERFDQTENLYLEIAEIFTETVTSNWNPESLTTIGFPKHAAKKPTIFLHRLGAAMDSPWLVYSANALLEFVLDNPEYFDLLFSRDPMNKGKYNAGLRLKDSLEQLLTNESLRNVFYKAYTIDEALKHVTTIYHNEDLLRAKYAGNPFWRIAAKYERLGYLERKGWASYRESIGGEELHTGDPLDRKGYFPTELWVQDDIAKDKRQAKIDQAWAAMAHSYYNQG